MLHARIDADTFRESIDAIAALVTECRLHTEEDGIWVRAVDSANVAMVTLDLKSNAFNEYHGSSGELGLDINKMKNIMGLTGKSDEITLELPDDAAKMSITFSGYHYSLALLDADTIRRDPNPPKIEDALPGKVIISGATLNNGVKAAMTVSDKIALGIDPDRETFFMEAEGDTDHIKLELGNDEVISIIPARARSLFSVDYLKDMGKIMSRAEEIEIYLGIDHPVKFSFSIAGGAGRVEYLLAPRIEAD
ncbi:MAG: DNA polymerase sliding clamp [Methanoculleaceae archaeon]